MEEIKEEVGGRRKGRGVKGEQGKERRVVCFGIRGKWTALFS